VLGIGLLIQRLAGDSYLRTFASTTKLEGRAFVADKEVTKRGLRL
jgi:hypothetical protein